MAGLAPAIVSIPPASLGHNIVAQPVAYLIPAVAAESAVKGVGNRRRWLSWAAVLTTAVILVSNGVCDLRDYFMIWPERGMVRFLYRADIHQAAEYLNQHPEMENLALNSNLAGPWDRVAFQVDMERTVLDRWFDPRRALVFPADGGHLILTTYPEPANELESIWQRATELVFVSDSFDLYSIKQPSLTGNRLPGHSPVAFSNGMVLTYVACLDESVLTGWRAEAPPFGLPPFRLISNPPPPGVDTRPRLAVFAHLVDPGGGVIAIDDGLWVDPYTLQPGDSWVQLHRFSHPIESADLRLGLYNPATQERVLLENQEDHLYISMNER